MISRAQDSDHYHEHIDALREGKRQGMMRIMRIGMPDDCPAYLRMDALNEEWAQKNHGQSLRRLNERGGLSASEAAAIIERRRWRQMPIAFALDVVKRYAVSETPSHE